MHDNATDWTSGYMPLIIGGVGAIGSALLMPWVVLSSPAVGRITRAGINSQAGKLFAVAVVVLALVARLEARTPRAATRAVLLVGLIALAVGAVVEYRDLSGLVQGVNADFGEARMGFGIYAMGLGLTAAISGVLKRRLLLQPEDGVRAVEATKG